MNRVKEVARINARDVDLQLASDTVGNAGKWDINKSWHAQYKDSAYCYVGGLPLDLSEGDIVVVFSQFGEIVDVNMPRDKDTGKPRGFAFIGYEDQRSTVLAVDNFNGAKLLGRTLRCDHCSSYHEEQKKSAENIPEHVKRKLSEQELERRRRDVEERNKELDIHSARKAELFSLARGTETEEEHAERLIRAQHQKDKDTDSARRSADHIATVLAKHRGKAEAEIAEEARLKKQREDRKRQREEELNRIAKPEAIVQVPVSEKSEDTESSKIRASRWDRFLNSSNRHSSKKQQHSREGTASQGATKKRGQQGNGEGPSGASRRAGEGMSVEDTNALRESLGLKPLRS